MLVFQALPSAPLATWARLRIACTVFERSEICVFL